MAGSPDQSAGIGSPSWGAPGVAVLPAADRPCGRHLVPAIPLSDVFEILKLPFRKFRVVRDCGKQRGETAVSPLAT